MTKLLSAHCNLKFLLRSFLFFLLIVSLFLRFFSFFTIAKSWRYRSLPETKQGLDGTEADWKEAEGSLSRGTRGTCSDNRREWPNSSYPRVPQARKNCVRIYTCIRVYLPLYRCTSSSARTFSNRKTESVRRLAMNIDNDNDEGDDALVRHRDSVRFDADIRRGREKM